MFSRNSRFLSSILIILLILSFWLIFILSLSMASIKNLINSNYKIYCDYGQWLMAVMNKDLAEIQSVGIAIFIITLLLMFYFIISYCFVHSTVRYRQKYAYIINAVISAILFLTLFILLMTNLGQGLLLMLIVFFTTGIISFSLFIISLIGIFSKTSYAFASII